MKKVLSFFRPKPSTHRSSEPALAAPASSSSSPVGPDSRAAAGYGTQHHRASAPPAVDPARRQSNPAVTDFFLTPASPSSSSATAAASQPADPPAHPSRASAEAEAQELSRAMEHAWPRERCNSADSVLEDDESGGGGGPPRRRPVTVEDFILLKVIGKGSFAKVLLVRKKDTGKLYAMKVLKKPHVVKRKQVAHTKTERNVLAMVDHPYVVRCRCAFQTADKLYFVLDYCPGGELFYHLSRRGTLQLAQARVYAAELVLALEHLHGLGVAYRDIKPENMLLDGHGHLKLADFGLAKDGVTRAHQGANSLCGTPEYLAPEVLERRGHGTAVDWWGLGMVLYEMLTGLPPWYTRDKKKLFQRLRSAPVPFPDDIDADARSLIAALLDRAPKRRLGARGADEVKAHPFFRGLDWAALQRRELPAPITPKAADAGAQTPALTSLTPNVEGHITRMPVDSSMAPAGPGAYPRAPSRCGSEAEEEVPSSLFRGFTFDAAGASPSSLSAIATTCSLQNDLCLGPVMPRLSASHPAPALLPAAFREEVLNAPEAFFAPSESLSERITSAIGALFDHTAARHPAAAALRALHSSGFDEEQIWAQLAMNNRPYNRSAKRSVKRLLQDPDSVSLSMPRAAESESESESEGGEDESELESEDEDGGTGNINGGRVRGDIEDSGDDAGAWDEDEGEDDDESSAGASAAVGGGEDEGDEGADVPVPSDGFFDWNDMEREADLGDDEMQFDVDDDGDEEEGSEEDEEEQEAWEAQNDAIDDAMETGDVSRLGEGTAAGMKYNEFFGKKGGAAAAAKRRRRTLKGDDEEEEEDEEEDDEEEEEEEEEDDDDEEEEEEDDDEEDKPKSSFAREQRRVRGEMDALEAEALARVSGTKPWELKGEAGAREREQNSLLEAEALDFERAVAPAPEVSVERSEALETIIKRRILAAEWDDVVRLPSAAEEAEQRRLHGGGEAAELSTERDRRGLGDVYAEEYERSILGNEAPDERAKERAELAVLLDEVSDKLDALSNFHFTPRPARHAEVEVRAAPAIAMEEAVPMGVSSASLRAPEEVFAAGRGVQRGGEGEGEGEGEGAGAGAGASRRAAKRKRQAAGKGKARGAGNAAEGGTVGLSEMSQEERKRSRRARKRAKRKEERRDEQDAKLAQRINPGLGNRYAKQKLRDELAQARNVRAGTVSADAPAQYSKSSEFFKRLQEQQELGAAGEAAAKARAKGARGVAPGAGGAKKSAANLKL
eukprot:g59.t1